MGSSFVNLLEGFEKLAYKLLIWIILIPKTIIKIILNPSFAPDYIHNELTHDRDSPFDEYMSPVLLYLGITLIPMLAIYFVPQYGISLVNPEDGTLFDETFEYSVSGRAVNLNATAVFKSNTFSLYHDIEWKLWQDSIYTNDGKDFSYLSTPGFVAGGRYNEWEGIDLPLNELGEVIQSDTQPMEGYFSISDASTIVYWISHEFTAPGDYRLEVTTQNFQYEQWEEPIEDYRVIYYISVPPVESDPMLVYYYGQQWTTTPLDLENTQSGADKSESAPRDLGDLFQRGSTIFIGMGLLIPPLIFALGINLFHIDKKQLSETDLKEVFYAQCYYFVPIGLTAWAWYYSGYFYTRDIAIPENFFIVPLWAVLIWFVVVEVGAIARGRKMKRTWYAIPILIACIFAIALLVFLTLVFMSEFSLLRLFAIWAYPISVFLLVISAITISVRKWRSSSRSKKDTTETIGSD